jgi:cytochrome c biogenesis protein CcdA
LNVKQLPARRAWFVILALVVANWLAPWTAQAEGIARFYYFFDPNCHVCEETQERVVDPLIEQYRGQVEVTKLSIAETANMGLMLQFEQQFGVAVGDIPEVVIGDQMLVGAFEIETRLPAQVERYLAEGGVALPEAAPPAAAASPTEACDECKETHVANRTAVAQNSAAESVQSADATIEMVFFYQPGCDECERSEHDLRYIQDLYPQVHIERFNVKEAAALNQYLCLKLGVPDEKHLTAPALFVGQTYLLAEAVRAPAIEAALAPLIDAGSPAWWLGWESEAGQVEQTIVQRFQSFGLLTVIGAGLIDGVNPCAFATMIFLISYLSLNKRKGRELLATGAAFTAGVFLTYIGVGFGLIKFLSALPFLNAIGKWVYGLTAILCLALAWGSLVDYRKAREGRLHDMGLTLPDRLRELSKRLIRQGTSAKRFVLSAFLLGIGVSVVELACTGQVYLPTIIYVLGVPALRARATLSLLLYNLMFIAPLIGVFLLVYFGTTSEQLVGWLTKRAAAVKLAMAILFVVLAAWLILSIIAL